MKAVIIGLHRQGNKPEKIAEIFRCDVAEVKQVLSEYNKFTDGWKIT